MWTHPRGRMYSHYSEKTSPANTEDKTPMALKCLGNNDTEVNRCIFFRIFPTHLSGPAFRYRV